MGQSARRSMQAALRTFLRFCLYQGYIRHPLDRAVPILRTYKLSTVPRGLSQQQAQKVIDAVDCSTNTGRRDYAILQLLHSYGVRGGQVRALRLEDIHWADNQILFRASKNGKDSLLPLSLQVGQSLLDYLRQARPRCSYPQVFITCRAPYHPLARSSSLSAIVERYIRAAGINVSSRGAHAFRHGFATRMVNKGYSLKAVADVLGHRHLSTTFIYTKVDFNFLVQQGLSRAHITREITDSYQQGLTTLAPRTQSNRMCVVRQFCEHLTGSDPQNYVPGPLKMIRSDRAHQPYIYNSRQLRALLAAGSGLLPLGSLRPHTYRTLLGLLYSTGIRISEAMALNIEDVQPSTQWLYIAEGKFRKARWVALSSSTGRALQHYIDRRFKSAPHSPDSPLLLNNRRRRLCHPTVNQTFRGLLQKCDIPHNKRIGPRIHDLRHTFAVHRLLAWYRQGYDVNARLPALATYMGHVDISSTHIYLQPTAELLEQVNQRFHNYYLHNIDPKGGQS